VKVHNLDGQSSRLAFGAAIHVRVLFELQGVQLLGSGRFIKPVELWEALDEIGAVIARFAKERKDRVIMVIVCHGPTQVQPHGTARLEVTPRRIPIFVISLVHDFHPRERWQGSVVPNRMSKLIVPNE